MNCKDCSCLHWHPNKGFFCTVPNCSPYTSAEDAREIYERTFNIQRRQAQWFQTNAFPHGVYCSACHKMIVPNKEYIEKLNMPMNYCPNCGAYMKETEFVIPTEKLEELLQKLKDNEA